MGWGLDSIVQAAAKQRLCAILPRQAMSGSAFFTGMRQSWFGLAAEVSAAPVLGGMGGETSGGFA